MSALSSAAVRWGQVSLYADWVAWLPAEPEDGEARGMRGQHRTEQRARQGPSPLERVLWLDVYSLAGG